MSDPWIEQYDQVEKAATTAQPKIKQNDVHLSGKRYLHSHLENFQPPLEQTFPTVSAGDYGLDNSKMLNICKSTALSSAQNG